MAEDNPVNQRVALMMLGRLGFKADVAILDVNMERLRYLDDIMPANVDVLFSDRHTIRDKLFKGEVVVASVLATRLKLAMGDEIELATSHGPRRFHICGIANDYMMGGYSIFYLLALERGSTPGGTSALSGGLIYLGGGTPTTLPVASNV